MSDIAVLIDTIRHRKDCIVMPSNGIPVLPKGGVFLYLSSIFTRHAGG